RSRTVMVVPATVCIVSPAGNTPNRPKLATYAVRPSGDSASSCGPRPTGSLTIVAPVSGLINDADCSDLLSTTNVSTGDACADTPATRATANSPMNLRTRVIAIMNNGV